MSFATLDNLSNPLKEIKRMNLGKPYFGEQAMTGQLVTSCWFKLTASYQISIPIDKS